MKTFMIYISKCWIFFFYEKTNYLSLSARTVPSITAQFNNMSAARKWRNF